ncbi:MAG: DNA polymerase III subunit alpha [Nanoarchaeota archaeon]
MSFVHLHLHSEYSFLDGSIQLEKLFQKVKELGQNSVAITEHGNMHALIKKYKLAKKYGIKLIIGCEIYVCDDINVKDKKRYHLLLLAKNNEGLQNLIKIVSIANKEGFYYKPRVDKSILKKYSKGVIATTACIAGEVQRAIIYGNLDKAKKITQDYIDIFGKDNFLIEVHNHGINEEKIINRELIKIAKDFDLTVIAANDAHYLNEDDNVAHDILLCIQTKKKLNDTNRLKFDGSGFYIKSEEEMRKLFPENIEFLENTQLIADKCNVEVDIGNTYFPEFDVPSNETHKTMLKKLCYEGLDEKYDKKADLKFYNEAKERLDFELETINKMGFAAYFLIVADFIREAKKFCQVGPGRGSGAGSIVAYLLGITQLEPLKLQLLFERFLNPERVSLPDFDVDFGNRDKVLEYIKNKYGEDNVALIGTYGTMMAKAVLKDVARVIGISFDVSNQITKYINEKTIEKSLNLKDDSGRLVNKELIEYKSKYPFLFEIAQKLEGTVRQPGIHACGVVWGPKKITDYLCVFKKDNNIVTQMDKDEVEDRGLVKFDFLGLETLNIIHKVLGYIDKGSKWLENIPIDDSGVYQMLTDAKSIGVFQLESPGMQKTLKLVKPKCFDDIIAIVALYRPGSMDFIDVYAKRKDGLEKVVYPHPLSEDILKPTYGILVYQEQVMLLSRVLAGFTMGESDVLRKAIGKKKIDLMNKMEGQFKEGCFKIAKMSKSEINKLWDNIVKFASYSFNKSHAAAYALISYRTAYLKYYYPLEFFTAIISSVTNDTEKMAFYVQQAKDEGITILTPDINKSDKYFSYEKKKDQKIIRFGFSGIKSVGDTAINEIINNRPYKHYQDFINKIDLSKVNKRILKHLIMCGAFDDLPHNRRELLNAFENITKEECGAKQKNLFGGYAQKNKIEMLAEYPLSDLLNFEIETLGLPITANLLDQYKIANNSRFDNLSHLVEDREYEIFVLVKNFKQIKTKNGDDMAFIDVMDNYTSCNVVVFPNVFLEIISEEIKENTPLIIEGIYRGGSILASRVQFYREKGNNSVYSQEQINNNNNNDDTKKKTLKEKVSLLNFS